MRAETEKGALRWRRVLLVGSSAARLARRGARGGAASSSRHASRGRSAYAGLAERQLGRAGAAAAHARPALMGCGGPHAEMEVIRILDSGWRCPFRRRKCFLAFMRNTMTCRVRGSVGVGMAKQLARKAKKTLYCRVLRLRRPIWVPVARLGRQKQRQQSAGGGSAAAATRLGSAGGQMRRGTTPQPCRPPAAPINNHSEAQG